MISEFILGLDYTLSFSTKLTSLDKFIVDSGYNTHRKLICNSWDQTHRYLISRQFCFGKPSTQTPATTAMIKPIIGWILNISRVCLNKWLHKVHKALSIQYYPNVMHKNHKTVSLHAQRRSVTFAKATGTGCKQLLKSVHTILFVQ